jgi:hypothetical protein
LERIAFKRMCKEQSVMLSIRHKGNSFKDNCFYNLWCIYFQRSLWFSREALYLTCCSVWVSGVNWRYPLLWQK